MKSVLWTKSARAACSVLLPVCFFIIAPGAGAGHAPVALDVRFDEPPVSFPVGEVELQGRITQPCAAATYDVIVEKAPPWMENVHAESPGVLPVCVGVTHTYADLTVYATIHQVPAFGSEGELVVRVTSTGGATGGHGAVTLRQGLMGRLVVTPAAWTSDGTGYRKEVEIRSEANAPLEVSLAVSGWTGGAPSGLSFPRSFSLAYDPAQQSRATAVFEFNGSYLGPNDRLFVTASLAPGGPVVFSEDLALGEPAPLSDRYPVPLPLPWARWVVGGSFALGLAIVGIASAWWRRGASMPVGQVAIRQDTREAGGRLRRAWRRVFAFAAVPVPHGPPAFRAGAMMLKLICWIASILLAFSVIVIVVISMEIAALSGTSDGLGGLGVALALMFLGMALAGAVTGGGIASVATFVATITYFGWLRQRRIALWAARLSGVAIVVLSALVAGTLAFEATTSGEVLFAVLFVVWWTAAMMLVAASFDPSVRGRFRARPDANESAARGVGPAGESS